VAQVCAAVEQVRSKRMSQRMWTNVMHSRAEPNVFLNHSTNRSGRDPRSLIIQKQRLFITLRNGRVHEKFITHLEITSYRRTRRISKWHDPLLSTLSRHP